MEHDNPRFTQDDRRANYWNSEEWKEKSKIYLEGKACARYTSHIFRQFAICSQVRVQNIPRYEQAGKLRQIAGMLQKFGGVLYFLLQFHVVKDNRLGTHINHEKRKANLKRIRWQQTTK